MIPGLLAALIAAGPLVGEREVAVLLLVVPRDRAPEVSASRLLDEVSEALEYRTRLEIAPPDRLGIDELALDRCELDRLHTCWVRVLRSAQGVDPRLGLIAVERPHGLALVALDLRRAARIIDSGSNPEAVESELYSTAIRPEEVPFEGSADLGVRIAEALEPGLRTLGLWFENGRIVLSAPPGEEVRVDGAPVATTEEGSTRLGGVPAGSRLIAVGDRFERRVSVPAGGSVLVEVPAPPVPSALRTVTIWSGVGVAVAGVAVTGWALAAAEPDRYGCLTSGGACPGPAGVGFRSVPESGATGPGAIDRSAVPAAAVGAGLLAAGVTWSLGALLFHDEDEDPWWALAGGLVVGGLALGVSSVVLR